MTGEAPIEEAIIDHFRGAGHPGVVTGWIVIAGSSTVDAEGAERSAIDLIFAHGNMPWIPALGLIEAARLKMHNDYTRGEP